MNEEEVRNITRKFLDEQHLLGFIKIFEKEHNLFRGSHDKLALPENLAVPEKIIQQVIEGGNFFRTITGITNDVVAGKSEDILTLETGNAILSILGTPATNNIKFTINQDQIEHDELAGFVADQHIDHSAVSISAGGILSGGGTIDENRTISLAHGDVDHDQLANTHNLTTDIDHDALNNYDAAEHFTMLDEDDLVSNSDTEAATQQSIKAYVDALPGATDEKVKVDVGATADYLGAAIDDGALRVSAPLTYADGGNFITLGVEQAAIDHDVLKNTHDNPYKLDDLATPDDNTDLDFSTTKHGLVPKGTNVGHFLKDDGTWAAGGGGGAVTFPGLTDTPADYVAAANKIVKVNVTPDALIFGANISDLEDVDSIAEQAGKYAKVKAGDAGVEWVTGTGGGGEQGAVLIFDSGFDDLALGDIDGKGDYSLWGAWVNGSGAGCTAEIVVDPGGGKMLRLNDQHAVNVSKATVTMTPGISAEVLVGIIEWKMKVNVLEAGSRGYFNIQDKDIAATGQGGFFRGDSDDIWYRSSGNVSGSLVNVVVDTWYTVRTFFDRLGNYSVWWVDGAFEQNRIAMNAGDKFDILELATWLHSGCVFDIKYVKAWSLNYVQ